MRRLAILFGAIVFVALFAWRAADALRTRQASQGARVQRPSGVVVQVTRVQLATLTLKATYLGEVGARARVDVFSRIPGVVASLAVDEGQSVRRGQLVARLDPKDLRFQLEQAQANAQTQRLQVDAARAALETQRARLAQLLAGTPAEQLRQAEEQLRQSRASLEHSQAQLRRVEELFKQGYVAQQQVDAARLDVTLQEARLRTAEQQLNLLLRGPGPEAIQVARAQVAEAEVAFHQAESRYAQALVAVRQAESLLAESTVYAPASGVVGKRFVDPGATVTQATPLIQLVDVDPVVITVAITERELSRIQPGMPVVVRTEAFPGKTFQGQVASISPVLATATRTTDVRLEIPNPERLLRPGMFADVEILLARREGVAAVPVDAVLERTTGRIVFVVQSQTARARPVEVGISDGTLIEIASGLREGEMVIIAGHRNLQDGAAVIVSDRPIPARRDAAPSDRPERRQRDGGPRP